MGDIDKNGSFVLLRVRTEGFNEETPHVLEIIESKIFLRIEKSAAVK